MARRGNAEDPNERDTLLLGGSSAAQRAEALTIVVVAANGAISNAIDCVLVCGGFDLLGYAIRLVGLEFTAAPFRAGRVFGPILRHAYLAQHTPTTSWP